MTESATGEVRNASTVVATSINPYSVSLSAPATYKPGLPWVITLKATNPDGTPRDGTYNVTLDARYSNGTNTLSSPSRLVTTSGGVATLTVTVPKQQAWCCNVTASQYSYGKDTQCCVYGVSANLYNTDNVYAGAYGSMATSPAQEYISLGAQSPPGPAAVGATVTFPVATTVPGGTAVAWVVTGGKGVAASGSAAAGSGISFAVPPGLGGDAKLLAFFQTTSGVAADVADVSVVPSMPQTVTAGFNQSAAQPGDTVAVSATATDAASRVWLLAVDKSVALLGGSTALNGSDLLSKVAASTSASADSMDRMFGGWNRCWSNQPPQEQAGVILFTSAPVPVCNNGGGVIMAGLPMAMAGAGAAMEDASVAKSNTAAPSPALAAGTTPTTRVRTLFPETWVWFSLPVDASGRATKAVDVPDTITSWQLSAFASGPSGLGVASGVAELAVSQPFYIRPALPYSLVREMPRCCFQMYFQWLWATGPAYEWAVLSPCAKLPALSGSQVRNETLLVSVGVYSTLAAATTATVAVTPSATGAFTVAGPTSVQVSLPAGGGSATAQFSLTPTALGPLLLTFAAATADGSASDAVQRTILVSPEGFPVTITQNVVVNSTTGSVVLPSALPADLVPGSATATVSVVGDLMGNSIKGLDQLVTVPSGCASHARTPFVTHRGRAAAAGACDYMCPAVLCLSSESRLCMSLLCLSTTGGEQNMITMAPNVYVLQYYNATRSGLTPDKAVRSGAHPISVLMAQRKVIALELKHE